MANVSVVKFLDSLVKGVKYSLTNEKISKADLEALFVSTPTYQLKDESSFCDGRFTLRLRITSYPNVQYWLESSSDSTFSDSTLISSVYIAFTPDYSTMHLYKITENSGLVVIPGYSGYRYICSFEIDSTNGNLSISDVQTMYSTRSESADAITYKNVYDPEIFEVFIYTKPSGHYMDLVHVYRAKGASLTLEEQSWAGLTGSYSQVFVFGRGLHNLTYTITGSSITINKVNVETLYFLPYHRSGNYYARFVPGWKPDLGSSYIGNSSPEVPTELLGIYYIKASDMFYAITFKEGTYDYTKDWYDTSGCFTIYRFIPPITFTKTDLVISDIIYDIL